MSEGLLRQVAKLTMFRPKQIEPTVLAAETTKAERSGAEIPIFINPKALTFPVLVGLVKGAWASAVLLPVGWVTSVFVPLTMCIVLGLLIAVSNLLDQKLRFVDWISGVLIGLCNSMVIFGAVMAIPRAGQ